MGKHCKQEVWKTISDYPCYQASNLGRIRRKQGKRVPKTRILNLYKNRGGYSFLKFSVNGTAYTKETHRITARLFVSNPENKPCVNHIDFNRQNNISTNLEWVTRSENMKHSVNANRLPTIFK